MLLLSSDTAASSKKRKHQDAENQVPALVKWPTTQVALSHIASQQPAHCLQCRRPMATTNSKKRKSAAVVGAVEKARASDILQVMLDRKDIWEDSIFPFVGVGEFAFVALVHPNLRDSYKAFVSRVENPPLVKLSHYSVDRRPAACTDTFYSATFANVSRAKFWENDISTAGSAKEAPADYASLVCTEAAKVGSIQVLQWARCRRRRGGDKKKTLHWDWRICAAAAAKGQLDLLKWARANGCEWNSMTCMNAAENGHLGLLQWARGNGCPWDEDTCSIAAQNGHLGVLQWAHENKCPWDHGTTYGAAVNGHLEVLKWARKHGCPWDSRVLRTEHLEVLEWSIEHGCPEQPEDDSEDEESEDEDESEDEED